MTRRPRFLSLSLSLLVGLAAAILAWSFVHLGSEMAEGETSVFDMVIRRTMPALRDGHPWAAPILRDLSALGSTAVMSICTTITVGCLTLGGLLAITHRRAVERSCIRSVATVMALPVRLRCVALGVHQATDVLAGWAYGFGWALIWLLIARKALADHAAETDGLGNLLP